MKYFASAAALLMGVAAAANAADDINDDELYPVAIVLDGSYRYELTELSCAKEERVQRASDKGKPTAYGQWLTQHVGSHSLTKAFSRFTGSAYDGGGCYERTPKGIRVYRPNEATTEVTAAVMPCRAQLVQSGTCAEQRTPPSTQTQQRWTPSPASSEKLIGTLMRQPYARSAEPFLFENQPAVLWVASCKLVAQMQMSEMEGSDFPFFQWQASQTGNVLTVQRTDGTYSQACYERTADGIRVYSFGNVEPYFMQWK
ncbi:MAG: hypothetical protein J0H05_00335 [Stenotrophomonas acidaminiphila]|uniref:hypothetical protein n=1 Tax=Stenotrophomonas acidaminiphila TaxID=128780 RepID=UPI000AFB3273|nr:hypothetical protein [Stenotrophomonas acidaminiphila]MBN8800107.1 hypothetical protein [Stenotrophomonas acidaminiphila]MDF9441086.1 hypothetical protein [Stenotrophomonas acidaminiphila]